MKKIFLIIFLLLFPTSIFAENNSISNTGTIVDEKDDKSLTEFILKRKDRIEEILKNSNNSDEKSLNEISENINSKKNNGEISREILKTLQNQFEDLSKTINEKNKEIELLNAKDSEKTKKEIKELENSKKELEKKIVLENDKILALEIEISELEIYKRKYESLVKENKEKELKEREKNLAIYIGIFLTYLVISGFGIKTIKNSQKRSIFSVVLTAIFITSIIILTLVINPGFVIIFIIIAGSMVLTFKDFIVSFISSILILRKYKIGDLVEIEGKKGTINSISALNTTLLTNSGEIFLLNNFLISKPLKLVEYENETSKIKIILKKEELKEKIKNIKNIFKNEEISFAITEKEDEKIELEVEITGINISEKLEKIF